MDPKEHAPSVRVRRSLRTVLHGCIVLIWVAVFRLLPQNLQHEQADAMVQGRHQMAA